MKATMETIDLEYIAKFLAEHQNNSPGYDYIYDLHCQILNSLPSDAVIGLNLINDTVDLLEEMGVIVFINHKWKVVKR